jgi:hypothetical protein
MIILIQIHNIKYCILGIQIFLIGKEIYKQLITIYFNYNILIKY